MNVQDYSQEQKEKINSRVLEALERSFQVNSYGKGTPFWMNLLFMLERFNRGNYYGTLELKILGTSCNDVKEKERTHKLQEVIKGP